MKAVFSHHLTASTNHTTHSGSTALAAHSKDSKSSKPSSSRDALSNITNARKSEGGLKKLGKSVKGVIAKDDKGKKEKKKRATCDPMCIEEEDTLVVSEAPSETPTWKDIDEEDLDDPQALTDYVNSIYEYLMEKEKDSVDPNYLSLHPDINEKMRSILVDWLIEVHRMFKLIPETLFLTVSILDRYLSRTAISRDHLQLVGVASMFIASKVEEIYPPECTDFVYIADGAYPKPQILETEQAILNSLKFNLTHPSPLHFLRRYSKAACSDYHIHTLCKYLIEMVLVYVEFLAYPASLTAAASVYLARAMTQSSEPLWNATLQHYTTYREEEVLECAREMNRLLKKSQMSPLAVKKKYSSSKFGGVSDIPPLDSL
eukprot:TRINITY_DN232_c0_g1_i1.p1 TRINITY_DN232_c0_g1~~TRINITY_DN232_c0_g1_i1.p1  ORF type:complete len:374 (+),score=61.99 TRINITY_DN232_c0_g1_i1:162-1283(+)